MSRIIVRLVVSVLCLCPVWAQQPRGTIFGLVTDASGAAIVGAAVTVLNVDTGATFSTTTLENGYYTAPTLAVGSYRVTVEQPGFKRAVRSGIVLEVERRVRVDFQLEIGTVTESLEVVGAAPLVDTASATVGKVVENRRLSDLPLNGRNTFALVMLTPGVKSNAGPTNSGFADRGIELSSVSINGGPSALNSYLLDGVTNNISYFADINANPTVDAVEEFKVQSNTMSAEFGFTAGGIVNVVTKSGTNTPHGNLYEFLRNDKFDARNTFSQTRPAFRYNQFGGTFGAPLYLPRIYNGRNRSFLFINYEGWRYSKTFNPILTVLTAEQREGNFSNLRDSAGRLIALYDPASTRVNPAGSGYVRDLFPGNLLPRPRLDPVSLNLLPFYPLPNRAPTDPYTNSNNFIASNQEKRSMQQYTPKLDHRLSAGNALFGRYTYYRHATDGGAGGGDLPNPVVRQRFDNLESRNFTLSDTHTFSPRLINEFRLGINRHYFVFRAAHYGGGWARKIGLPESVPDVTMPRPVNGLPGFRTGTSGVRGTLTWQFFEMATHIRGGHTIKFGTDVRLQRGNNFQETEPSGTFQFPAALTSNPQSPAGTGYSPATFLLGAVGSATAGTYLGQAQHGYSLSYFVQDDWKLTRRLTLNLGLRYDYQQWPVERHNGATNFNPFAIDPKTKLLGRLEFAGIDYGRSAFQPDRNDFAPRLGLAYDLTGKSSTVFRAGYAIFYPSIFFFENFGNSAGFAVTQTQYQPPGGNANFPAFQFKDGFPFPLIQPQGAALGPSAFLGSAVDYDQSNARVPMSQQWTASLQHQLPGGWLIDVGYSANHGTKLVAAGYDFAQLDLAHWALGLRLQDRVANPYAGIVPGALGAATLTRSQLLKPYPYYTSVNVRTPHMGNSIYHALLVSVEKRLGRGLAMLVSYTNSKLISDSVVSPLRFGSAEQVGIYSYQNGKFDRRSERSLDPADTAQRFVWSAVYELPFGKGRKWASAGRVTEALAGGWQVNTITTLQGGLPLLVRGANNFRADRPNSTGVSPRLETRTAARWFDTTAFRNPADFTLGNLGRVVPDARTPGAFNIDLSLIKDTRIREGLRLQFRAETFNIANQVNLGIPDTTFVPGPDGLNRSGTFGVITAARDARIGQLGLKLIF
jgi:outer membrane receptor protein involved in Fe transport